MSPRVTCLRAYSAHRIVPFGWARVSSTNSYPRFRSRSKSASWRAIEQVRPKSRGGTSLALPGTIGISRTSGAACQPFDQDSPDARPAKPGFDQKSRGDFAGDWGSQGHRSCASTWNDMQARASQVGVEPKLHVQRVERNAIEALKAIGETAPSVSTATQQDICGQRNRMTVIDAGI